MAIRRKRKKAKKTTTPRVSLADRNNTIKTLYLEGATLEDLGRKYEISRQRVSQILYGLGIEPHEKLWYGETNKSHYERIYKEKAEKLKATYEVKLENHAKLIQDYNNAKAIINNKERRIAKLKEEIKNLRNNSLFLEEINSYKKTILNLRCQLNYYKNERGRGNNGN